jgi:hypothetical protein
MRSILTKLPYGDELATLEPLTMVLLIFARCSGVLLVVLTGGQDAQFPEINLQQKLNSHQLQEQ